MTKLAQFEELTLLEQAKVDFQENVSALIEIESALNRKAVHAKTNKKPVFIDLEEAQIITKHLRMILAQLLRSYEQINHASMHLIFQNRMMLVKADPIAYKPGELVREITEKLKQNEG